MDRGFRRTLLFETPADKGSSKRWETLVINCRSHLLCTIVLLIRLFAKASLIYGASITKRYEGLGCKYHISAFIYCFLVVKSYYLSLFKYSFIKNKMGMKGL